MKNELILPRIRFIIIAGAHTLQQMVDAFTESYDNRDIDRKQLREFAETYSIDNVAEKYMGPAVAELAQRMANR